MNNDFVFHIHKRKNYKQNDNEYDSLSSFVMSLKAKLWLEELDQNHEIMSLRYKRNLLLRKGYMLEAIEKVTLEAKEMEIGVLKQNLDQLDNTVMFYKGVFEATERKVTQLKQKLQEQDSRQWKLKNGFTV